MPHEFRLPALDGSAATVEQWYKVPGEQVAAGEALVLVRTARAAYDLPAPASGALDIRAADGPVAADAVLALLGAADAPPAPRRWATPLARKIAALQGLDLAGVAGSGRGGRIVRADLVPAVAAPTVTPTAPSVAAPSAPPAVPPAATAVLPAAPPAAPALHLPSAAPVAADLDVPVALTAIEIELDSLLALCRRENGRGPRGVALTPLLCIAHAVAHALLTHRALNAAWHDDGVILRGRVDLAITAPAGERVIADAASLSRTGLARAYAAAGAGAAGAATFAVQSLASQWQSLALPRGHAATLGLGATQRRAVVVTTPDGEQLRAGTVAWLALAYDARLADQATADAFLVTMKAALAALG